MTDAVASPQTVAAAYDRLRARLAEGDTPTPALDARWLIAAAGGFEVGAVHRASGLSLPAEAVAHLETMVKRCEAGEPVHRVIGYRPFFEHDFRLSPDTLEPRPDTEILVGEAASVLHRIVAARGAARFVDIGTGSGAIAVSLLALCPQARCVATDIAPGALETASINAAAACVADRFEPVRANYCNGLQGPFDLIVSNPPYIATGDLAGLSRAVRDHDPMAALDGGADGLTAYRAIAAGSGALLGPDGAILVEIGAGMGEAVVQVFAKAGFALDRRADDLAGIERVLGFAALR